MTRAFREQPQSLSRAHRPADTAAALQALSIPEAAESLLRMPIADAVGALDRPEFANAAKVLALLSPAQAGELVAGMADDRALTFWPPWARKAARFSADCPAICVIAWRA